MQFKFQKNLAYQTEAINSVVNLFEGARVEKNSAVSVFQLAPSSIVANVLDIGLGALANNLHRVQIENNLESTAEALTNQKPLDFSIEMETGTGKTYVYLRTILELNQKYGLSKFIILVPSVAIREGVLKTIEQTKEHFRDLYNTGFGYFVYDSKKLSQVRDFAQSTDIQVMVMTIQSFNSDTNILRQDNLDRFYGQRPIDTIAETRPVVIMDEPQNMESELAQSAIETLNPLFKLRYSATHRNIHNLVYRLSPVDAYRQGLVKKIAVYGVRESDPNTFVFKVQEIITQKGKDPHAKVSLEVKKSDGSYEIKETKLSLGDSVFRKSKNNEKYEGLEVTEISARNNTVELSDGNTYKLEEESENKEVVFRTQIRETIKAHFNKQKELGEKVKVLSLFFIDKVDNYIHKDSLIRTLFTEEFEKLARGTSWEKTEVDSIHTGYFASKKVKGVIEYKDSTGRENKEDREAFTLIMKDKERLLSLEEPVSFIFSHSALKEGWDNPNIFQICTLRETQSIMKKRQEIGRGLRLPVDCNGERIYDPEINILTVVANESYEEYAKGLQQEFTEAGYDGYSKPINLRAEKIKVTTTKYLESEEFKELWKRISRKTKYHLEVKTDQLLESSISDINDIDVSAASVVIERGLIDFNAKGQVNEVRDGTAIGYRPDKRITISNIIRRVSVETGLTRKTVFNIFSKIENTDLIFENPEAFIREVIMVINKNLHELLIDKGLKYIPTGEVWEMNLFGDFEAYENKLVEADRSVYSYVVFDSEGEKIFANSLSANPSVKVFTKLPYGFRVDTPFGEYNPDWAIVKKTDEGDKLYLVRETKFVDDLDNLRPSEKNKIHAGEKHFEALDVDFKVSTKTDLSDL